ncbi:hypothetical protein Tco_0104877 [Tanacetum coccineum]
MLTLFIFATCELFTPDPTLKDRLYFSRFKRLFCYADYSLEAYSRLLTSLLADDLMVSPDCDKEMKMELEGEDVGIRYIYSDASSDKKTSITIITQSKDLGADSMVISSLVGHVIDVSGEHTQLEKGFSANLDTTENVRSIMGLNVANEEELIRLGQAVATLIYMRAIVEFQTLVRSQIVRHSRNRSQGEPVHKERANLLQTSLKSKKLSTNAFGAKLVASSSTTMPLNRQYDPAEPNLVMNWLEPWSSSHFWEPLPLRKMKQGNFAKKQASVAAKNMKLLLMKEVKAICQLTSPIQLKLVSLGRNDTVAQLSLTAIIGLVPGLIIAKDLFVRKTKKKLDVDSHVVH